jgi:hypothetical protein
MASKNDILKELDFVTDRLSTQVRSVALGVLAFSWGLIVSDSRVAQDLRELLIKNLVGIGAAAIVVMLFDFLQYLAGYSNTMKAYKEMESLRTDHAEYDEDNKFFKLRKFFFYAKIVGVTLTVLWLVGALGYWIAFTKPSSGCV